MDESRPTGSRPLATVSTVGWIVGAVLAVALVAILVIGRSVHVAEVGGSNLMPWRLFVGWAVLALGLYWFGLRYLVRRLRRHDAAKRQLICDLTEANENLELAQKLGRTGTWTAVRDGPITWTGSAAQLLGLPSSQTRVSPAGFLDLVHPDERKRAMAAYFHALRSRGTLALDIRMCPPDGSVRWLSIRGAVSEDRTCIAGTIVDVTRQIRAHERLVTAEHQFRLLFDENPLPFCVYDGETLQILEANKALVEQFGYSREELLQRTIVDMVPPDQRAAGFAQVREHAGLSRMAPRVWTAITRDGRAREVRVHASAIRFRNRPAWLILAEDITRQLAQQRELAYRATHDSVTGLLNGRAFAEQLQAQADRPWRLAYLQFRGLELIEDSLGQEAACRVVQRLSQRLALLVERDGLAGHLRPEEFVLAVPDTDEWDDTLQALRAALTRPISGNDSRQQLDSWLGTARFPANHPDAAEAIRLAGLAAHTARTDGRPIAAYEPSMSDRAGARLRMATRLHRAIANCEFTLHFQEIRDLRTGRAAGLEALIRWPQPSGESIPPNDFIGVAEDTGLIVPLGRWVLQEAARMRGRLQATGHGRLSIAVNVSQAQFLKSDLLHDFDEVLAGFPLPRGALHIEMTESVLMSRPEQSRAILAQLQARGVCVSLDDFGTGFSSMAYLQQLPIDAIKIDRSFVRGVHVDERNAAICQALLTLGQRLGLTVVAEGVEEQGEYDWLRRHGCDQAQGFCIARPAPLEEVLASL